MTLDLFHRQAGLTYSVSGAHTGNDIRCNICSELTASSPPPIAPPKGMQEEPAQVPLKQFRPVQEREEQLMPKHMPLGPQSSPAQPRLRQLSPKHYDQVFKESAIIPY